LLTPDTRHPRPETRRALALVLHSHMPYVEGFGTWPFGEEWLWEAVATVYLPLLDVVRDQPVTVGLTPVLCDQLEPLTGEGESASSPSCARSARPFTRWTRRRSPASRGLPPSCAARRATTRAPRLRSRRSGETCWARSASSSCGRAPPPTRCCRCSRQTAGGLCSFTPASPLTSGASATGPEASGCRNAATSRGSNETWPS